MPLTVTSVRPGSAPNSEWSSEATVTGGRILAAPQPAPLLFPSPLAHRHGHAHAYAIHLNTLGEPQRSTGQSATDELRALKPTKDSKAYLENAVQGSLATGLLVILCSKFCRTLRCACNVRVAQDESSVGWPCVSACVSMGDI